MDKSNIPNYIERALSLNGGYSKEFSDRIAKICEILSDHFDFPIHHDSDMNYRAGQSLSFSFLDRPPYSLSKKGYINIKVFFSSRADLFCFFCLDERKGEYFVPPETLPHTIQKVLEICRNILNDMGFKEVENHLLNIIIPTSFTILDNLPATIFQILFSEIE